MKYNTFYEDQSFTSCFKSEGTNKKLNAPRTICIIKFYTGIPTPKTGNFSKVETFVKSILTPPPLYTLYFESKTNVMHVLSLICPAMISQQFCQSQILFFFLPFSKFWENANFVIF